MTCGAFRGAAYCSIRNGSRVKISKRIPVHEREALSAIPPPMMHVPSGDTNEHPWLVMNVPWSHTTQSVGFGPLHDWQAAEHDGQPPPELKVDGCVQLEFDKRHCSGWLKEAPRPDLHNVHAPVPSEHSSQVE